MVRDLTHAGMGVKAVAGVHPQQQVRLRFELRPRLSIETRGEVVWATPTGQCGIRFLDMSPRMARQINEWIFGNMLEGAASNAGRPGPLFAEWSFDTPFSAPATESDDGLIVSSTPVNVIQLPVRPQPPQAVQVGDASQSIPSARAELDWLSQPLSGRSLAWTVNVLVVLAALLLSALVFLSVTREPPKWPLAMATGAAFFVAVFYLGFSWLFGGATLGARLARLAGSESEEEAETRFR